MAEGVAELAASSQAASSPGLDKPIYTISVAAEILETHPRTLMMYESMGLVVPQRTSTNRRRFSQRDVYKLQTVRDLTRNHGLNLTGVRYVLDLLTTLHDQGVAPPDSFHGIDFSLLSPPPRSENGSSHQ